MKETEGTLRKKIEIVAPSKKIQDSLESWIPRAASGFRILCQQNLMVPDSNR